jgi:hypothetical protein
VAVTGSVTADMQSCAVGCGRRPLVAGWRAARFRWSQRTKKRLPGWSRKPLWPGFPNQAAKAAVIRRLAISSSPSMQFA